MNEMVTIKVEGMTCGGCETSIRKALEQLEGVLVLDASHTEGTVEVLYDPQLVAADALKSAIEEAGYDVAAT